MKRQLLKKEPKIKDFYNQDSGYHNEPYMTVVTETKQEGDNKTITYNKYYNPHHHSDYVDWGGSCFWLMFFIIILFFLAIFLIIWFVPYPYNNTSKLPTKTESASSGGHAIPGLATVSITSGSNDPMGCVLGEFYNGSAHLCQPRMYLPHGVDEDLFDRNVNQCESFYRHSCGNWLNAHEPKLDPSNHINRIDRSFGYLFHLNQYHLSHIISRSAGTPIGNFYHSCVDALVNGRQESQVDSYQTHLKNTILNKLTHVNQLPVVFAHLQHLGFTTPVPLGIEEHPSLPQMVPFFGNDGFRDVNEQEVIDLFKRGRNNDAMARKKAKQFLTLNALIERHRPNDSTDMGTSMKSFTNYLSGPLFIQDIVYVNDVMRLMHISFDGATFIQQLGLSFPDYHLAWIRDKHFYMWFFGNFGPVKSNDRLGQWKAYVEYSILYNTFDFYPHLPQNVFVTESDDIEEDRRVKRGLSSWKRKTNTKYTHETCKRLTEELLPGYVSEQFLKLTQSKVVDERVEEIAINIRSRLKRIISDATYMTSHDKRWTIKKLDNIIIRIGHPHAWKKRTIW